jgi:hypothetical protein
VVFGSFGVVYCYGYGFCLWLGLDFERGWFCCCCRSIAVLSEFDFVHARLFDWREEDEVLLSDDLHVYVFVVVAVHGCHGALVPEPEVDGVGALFEGDAGPGDVGGDVGEEGVVFSAEVVVFFVLLVDEIDLSGLERGCC